MTESLPQLVCFDLDGTVMLRPNSLQYLLALNNAPLEILADIDAREAGGQTDWIAADYERAPFIAGLPVAAIEDRIDEVLVTVPNLGPVLHTLRGHGILTVLITSGPVEVAQAVARRFAFDHCFGSDFEKGGGGHPVYSGRVVRHLGSRGKLDCLTQLCQDVRITLGACVAVGDGESDVDLFRAVGTSIGIDCAPEVAVWVQHQVDGRDLSAILPLVLPVGTSGRASKREPTCPGNREKELRVTQTIIERSAAAGLYEDTEGGADESQNGASSGREDQPAS